MKRLAVIGLLTVFSMSAMAASNDAKLKGLAKKGVGSKVTSPNYDKEVRAGLKVDQEAVKKFRARTLPPAKRDAAFVTAGVDAKVAGWSENDKDMLVVRAREFSPDKLALAYPDWDAASLSKLQGAVKK